MNIRLMPALLYLAAVLLHIALGLGMQVPHIYPDELGYLGTARFLAGAGLLTDARVVYYPGYSLFLVPAFWLFHTPVAAYHACLISNALLLGLTAPAIYWLSEALWPECSGGLRVLATLAIAGYPPLLVYANVATSENALIPAVVLVCLLAAHTFAARSWPRWAAWGTSLGALYTVHPRGLAVLIAGVLIAARSLWPWPRQLRPLAGLAGGIAASLLAGNWLLHYLAVAHQAAGHQVLHYFGSESIAAGASHAVIRNMSHWRGLGLLARLAGQAFYLSVATYGLFIVGMAVALLALQEVLLQRESSVVSQVAALAGLALAGTWLLSALAVGGAGRADQLIYGRYNEAVLAPVLLLGIIGLAQPDWQRRIGLAAWQGLALGGLVLSGLVLWLSHPAAAFAESIGYFNVLGLYPILAGMGRIDVPWLTAAGIVAGGATIYLVHSRPRLGLAILALAFATTGCYTTEQFLVASSRVRAEQHVVVDVLQALDVRLHQHVGCVSYDVAAMATAPLTFWHFYSYQFLMPDTALRLMDTRRDRSTCSDLIVSGRLDLATVYPGARLVTLENQSLPLWVRPGKLQATLAAAGFLLPAAFPGALPAGAYRSRLRIESPLQEGLVTSLRHPAKLKLAVTHTGRGSPWPNLAGMQWAAQFGIAPRQYSVRVGVTWWTRGAAPRRVGESRANLPATMMPGATNLIYVGLIALAGDRTPLPAGTYDVHIGLIQEGVGWFTARGDHELSLPVKVEQ